MQLRVAKMGNGCSLGRREAESHRLRPILRGGCVRERSARRKVYYQTNAWSPIAAHGKILKAVLGPERTIRASGGVLFGWQRSGGLNPGPGPIAGFELGRPAVASKHQRRQTTRAQ